MVSEKMKAKVIGLVTAAVGSFLRKPGHAVDMSRVAEAVRAFSRARPRLSGPPIRWRLRVQCRC